MSRWTGVLPGSSERIIKATLVETVLSGQLDGLEYRLAQDGSHLDGRAAPISIPPGMHPRRT